MCASGTHLAPGDAAEQRLGGCGRRRTTTLRSPAFSQRHAVAEEDRAQGGNMPQPGDIVIERLTGNRAIVIRVVSPEEMICRLRDGRFEERFTFELEPPPSPLASLLSFFVSSFLSWFRQSPAASVEGPRPALARSRAS